VFGGQKVRTRVTGKVAFHPMAGADLDAYEIHMGRTGGDCAPFCTLSDGRAEGAAQGSVFGTYLHGLFDEGSVVSALADWLLRRKGMDPAEIRVESHRDYQERQYDLLADAVRQSLDLRAVYRAMEEYEHGTAHQTGGH
ncbi:MAG: cobyric acid synthase CobQ, partial [Oscillospiraceae bacterium]|nr:cobyric acid synthase CobQ [Oscillospiraceae bacterium]